MVYLSIYLQGTAVCQTYWFRLNFDHEMFSANRKDLKMRKPCLFKPNYFNRYKKLIDVHEVLSSRLLMQSNKSITKSIKPMM